MPFNLPVSIPQDSGYKIARSLRFNRPDLAYLTRTPVTASNRDVMTFHCWVKRAGIGLDHYLFEGYSDNVNRTSIAFTAADKLDFITQTATTVVFRRTSTRLFRDPAAWMAVTVSVNTNTSTYRVWIGPDEITAWDVNTIPAAGTDTWLNSAVAHNIGRFGLSANYLDGYMAHVHFIDGLALDYTAFLSQDPTTGVWGPKEYTGLYGTNGFKLDFADNSAVTAATLGKDRSGMSNMLTHSDAFSPIWAIGANGVFTGGQADPLGGTGAFHFAIGANTANAYFFAAFTPVVGQTTTLTIYAKAGVFTQISVYNGNANGGQGYYDLAAGSLISSANTGTGTGTVAKIEPVAGQPGWYKCSVTTTHQTVAADNVLIQLIGPSTTNGQGLTVFRASRTLGSTTPAELQYTNGAAVPDKNWTPNNFSVTAGVGNDSLVDTPTNYGTPDANGGGVVRGNYCTINPIDASVAANIAISDGNLKVLAASATWGAARSTMWVNSGKWYWEIAASGGAHIGIWGPSTVLAGLATLAYVGMSADSYAYTYDGGKLTNASGTVAYGTSYVGGATVGVALDMDAGTLTFYNNGVSQGVAYSGLSGFFSPAFSVINAGGGDFNFGQRAFTYPAPPGFKALCTQNLPDPAVKRGDDAMTTHLYTGNTLAINVTGKRFKPEIVVMRARNIVSDLYYYDNARGPTLEKPEPTLAAESAQAQGLTSFNADGFSMGNRFSGSGNTWADWLWKKDPVPGIDAVIYTGNGVARTIPHSLGVAPRMIILTQRPGAYNFFVYHASLGPTIYKILNGTLIATVEPTLWNNTAPTNTVFTVGTSIAVNETTKGYVAYLFADVPGFSKIGSYTGNGNANGPFIPLGFRPQWLILKRTDVADNWWVIDAARLPVNGSTAILFTNITNAEHVTAGLEIDFLSNGFKLRHTTAASNASGGNYIFAAFAESPFKYARAR